MMFPWVPAASNPQRGMRTIEVVESDPTWPVQFETERARLASVLGEGVVAIHHIGSTAVPGLAAKPVIDLLVEVRDLAALDARMAKPGFFEDHDASSKALAERGRLVAEQESAWAEVGTLEG